MVPSRRDGYVYCVSSEISAKFTLWDLLELCHSEITAQNSLFAELEPSAGLKTTKQGEKRGYLGSLDAILIK